MQPATHRCSFLIYVLIPQIILFPLLGRAADIAQEPGSTGPIPTSLKVAVVALNDGKVKPDLVEKVVDTLRDELSHREGFDVLSKEATQHFFESSPDLRAAEVHSNGLNRYLEQAKEYYKSFNFKEAVSLLENTIDGYRNSGTALADL